MDDPHVSQGLELKIEFSLDRYAEKRLSEAYQIIEEASERPAGSQDSVQIPPPDLATAPISMEAQG